MQILENYSLKKANTWMIGGAAQRCLMPESLQELQTWIKKNPGEKLVWLGLGSNILLADDTLPITVVLSRTFLKNITREADQWIIDAGVNCARIARDCSNVGFRDAVFFCGIPGTLGGAVRMNAGAFGGETWRHIDWVEVLEPDGEVVRYDKSSFNVSYRHVDMPSDGWIVRAALTFRDQQDTSQNALISALLKKRMASQPIGVFSCGSVFKNPEGDYAARLIEAVGLKGRRIGYAEVSEKHANFMINVDGLCTAQDMLALMKLAQEEVYQKFGIMLDPEVHCIGFDS